MTYATRGRPAPWLFGITALPYGVYSGFISTAMPYLLRNAGVTVDRIAGIGSLALAPAVWCFLWSPVADVGLRRRTWLILSSALSAICLWGALLQPLPGGLDRFVTLIVAGSTLSSLVSAANGGLMAETIADSERGRAGGWYQAGNVGGGALGAGATIWLLRRLTASELAMASAAMVTLPSLAALWIAEPSPARQQTGKLVREMLVEVKGMLTTRVSLIGLAILLSPMGASAAGNLFAGVAVDFSAPESMVVWINGFGGAVLTTLGSLGGGLLCDRIPRRTAYAVAALLSASCAIAMIAAPLTKATFAVGVSAYLLAQGVAFAAGAALTLELIGEAGRSGATRYTLYNAAANLPVLYMTWLDGQGYKRSGVRGMLGLDAFSNVVAAVICLILLYRSHTILPAKEA